MTLFSRSRVRRIATQLMLAWLFALTAGVVNACVLEPPDCHGDAALALHAAAVADAQDAAVAPDDHHAPSAAVKTPCAKFCDDSSAGAQALKQQLQPAGLAWLAPPPAPVLPLVVPPGGFDASDHRRWRPAVPIAIAFLRLSL